MDNAKDVATAQPLANAPGTTPAPQPDDTKARRSHFLGSIRRTLGEMIAFLETEFKGHPAIDRAKQKLSEAGDALKEHPESDPAGSGIHPQGSLATLPAGQTAEQVAPASPANGDPAAPAGTVVTPATGGVAQPGTPTPSSVA